MDSFNQQLKSLKNKGLYRSLKTFEGDVLNFSSNNYLGLANHPVLKKAAAEAALKYGTGSGASRLITGSIPIHRELEEAIADFKGTEAALLFNSGYHANIGIISALMNEGDLIFSDELNHASLIDGCRLSRAETKVYRHGDMEDLEQLLENPPQSPASIGGRKLIITDTVFSMDGDLCNLPEIMRLAEKYDSWVLVDEAHATGVYGKKGRGVVEHFGIDSRHPRLIQMGTLGKALGSFGAYVCGPKSLIEFLINKARSFIYTTALPPSVCAASLAAVRLIREDTSLKEKLWENVRYFVGAYCNTPLPRGNSPIIPIIIGESKKTMEVAEELFEQGIWAHGIRPPTVPEGTARIRLTLMATHTKEQLDRCLEALKKCGINA